MYLDELERLAAPLPPVQQQGGEKDLAEHCPCPRGAWATKPTLCWPGQVTAPTRTTTTPANWWWRTPKPGVRYFLVKPSDVAIYVEHGAADIGIVGKDILTESGADVYELLDTGMGKCRMCVAGPKTLWMMRAAPCGWRPSS